ncbi:MAG: RidA family protein [Calditrichaeota bacterium]|nr:RidA family protein [Calditrichota bacterium]
MNVNGDSHLNPQRRNISSGSPWEPIIGYSRAVSIGGLVFVSGTTATDEFGNVVGEGDVYVQTLCALRKIDQALSEAGSSRTDVVRTRMFVTDISTWKEVGRAHQEFFGNIRPAATMVEVKRLISPGLLVEIEVDAVTGEPYHLTNRT